MLDARFWIKKQGLPHFNQYPETSIQDLFITAPQYVETLAQTGNAKELTLSHPPSIIEAAIPVTITWHQGGLDTHVKIFAYGRRLDTNKNMN
jgi:hypothetical protein